MYKKCKSNSYLQTVQKIFKVQIKVAWNLKCEFFVHINKVQTIQNLYN